DIDGYYEKFSDIQGGAVITFGTVTTRTTSNVGTAHYDGFEGELDWAPTKDLTVRVNGSYFNARYDSILPNALSSTFNLTTPIVGAAARAYPYSIGDTYPGHPYRDTMVPLSLNYKPTAPLLPCQTGAVYICTTPAYGLLGGQISYQPSPDSPWNFA